MFFASTVYYGIFSSWLPWCHSCYSNHGAYFDENVKLNKQAHTKTATNIFLFETSAETASWAECRHFTYKHTKIISDYNLLVSTLWLKTCIKNRPHVSVLLEFSNGNIWSCALIFTFSDMFFKSIESQYSFDVAAWSVKTHITNIL